MGCSSSKRDPDMDDPSTYYDMSPVANHPVIFVTGVPGAGNATVAATITSMTGYYLIRPSELIRREIGRDTERAREIQRKIIEEKEISEQQTVNLIKEEMIRNTNAQGFVLLDFPRNAKMSKLFQKQVKIPEKIVSLSMDEEAATTKLQNRLSELGRPESEISSVKQIVDEAADNIRNIRKRFYGKCVTLNNDENSANLASTLKSALSDYLKQPAEQSYLREKTSIIYNPQGILDPETKRPFVGKPGVTIIPAQSVYWTRSTIIHRPYISISTYMTIFRKLNYIF